MAKYMREKRRADPEKARADVKSWRRANPERAKALDAKSNAKRQASGYKKDYRAAHPGKEAAALRAARRADPERHRARDRARYAANAECIRTEKTEWRKAHPAKVRAILKKHHASKPTEFWTEKARGWRTKNPTRWRILSQNGAEQRRARMKQVACTLTHDEWAEILECFGYACAYCLRTGLKLEQEHVIPISKGGAHTAENVVPSCVECNRRKQARGPLAMVNRAA